MRVKNSTAAFKNGLVVPKKESSKTELSDDPGIPFIDKYSKELKTSLRTMAGVKDGL